MKIYQKLVRDRIPEIIEKSGKTCSVRRLSPEDYLQSLRTKLSEELSEYLESGELSELADLLEVLLATAEAEGYTKEELEAVRRQKAEARGGFRERLLLEWVED